MMVYGRAVSTRDLPTVLEKPFMRSGIITCVALGAVLLIDPPLQAQRRGRDQDAVKHGWLSSLQEGRSQARQSGKPLMVVLRCVP